MIDAVEHIAETLERFHAMIQDETRSQLKHLRRELDESMRVAREVERRTEQMTRTSQDEARQYE